MNFLDSPAPLLPRKRPKASIMLFMNWMACSGVRLSRSAPMSSSCFFIANLIMGAMGVSFSSISEMKALESSQSPDIFLKILQMLYYFPENCEKADTQTE